MFFMTRCMSFLTRGSHVRNSNETRLARFSARSVAAFLVIPAMLTCAMGQRGSMGHAGMVHAAGSGRGMTSRSNALVGGMSSGRGMLSNYGAHRANRYGSTYASLPFPFFGDAFDPNDIYSTGYPVASEPSAFVLQAARELSASPDYRSGGLGSSGSERGAAPSAQPLMIELQNGRYVRVNTSPVDGDARELEQPAEPAIVAQTEADKRAHSTRRPAVGPALQAATPATDSATNNLPSALLVFRDGHSEQVRDYTIADGVLYARGDFYTDGYWNKKIDLSTLNLSATVRGNADRNVKFVLPSSPNEVVTRP
jgi:hypothetical protein